MMNEAVKIAKYMSEFLFDYAPNYLTYSTHTIKSYKDTLTLYISFLESVGITPNNLSKKQFEKESIMEWITWMQHIRGCCPDTCNVRLGALRVFLEYLGSKDIEFLYLYQEAKTISCFSYIPRAKFKHKNRTKGYCISDIALWYSSKNR